MIPLSGPDISDREMELVMEVLKSGQLGLGPKMLEFEANMAQFAGTKYAVACNSGTSGLHMLVHALGIGQGDEVITTPFSFVASANCILFERATPVFVDIEPDTYNIDPERLEAAITKRTKAILPVHVFGQPANMDAIRDLAKRYNLAVIEDACEAIGAKWDGKMAGSLGNAGVFAFYPNKQMTTGEGGVVVTDDKSLADLCRSLRNQGRGDGGAWLEHVRLGWNYRLDELSCALGVAQLERIDSILAARTRVADQYIEAFRDVPGVITQRIHPLAQMSWFVFVIRFEPDIDRDAVMRDLLAQEIGCRPYFSPIHLQPFYTERFHYRRGDYPNAELVGDSALALPFYNQLSDHDLRTVVQAVERAVRSQRAKR